MVDKTQFADIDRSKHGKLIEFMTDAFKSVEIAGKNVIQTPDGEFIEYVLMEEKYFIDNWLVQFAIGHVGEKNYFNHEAWSRLTNAFTKGVIVLNEDKQPVVLIRKFIDMDLNYMQKHHLQDVAGQASDAKFIPNKEEADELVNRFAEAVKVITSQNPDYDTLTSMIPLEYYLRNGVDPTVVKQVIYIRDNYKINDEPIEPDCEVMKEVEAILYKYARMEPVTAKEKALVTEVTNGDFIFDESPNKVEDKVNQTAESDQAADFDPLAE